MTSANFAIADVQSRRDTRNISISEVGVKGLKHPIFVQTESGENLPTVADFTMTVSLPPTVKGTHMSRFVALLNEAPFIFTLKNYSCLLDQMLTKLQSDQGKIQSEFDFFVMKTAPVSGVKSLLDYRVKASAKLQEGKIQSMLEVVVPITSLCPCSKEISDYGAHNQRSHVTITIQTLENNITIEQLIHIAEKQASSELYGLLKRSDEKYVTEYAYNNPKFVEDLVRDIASDIEVLPNIIGYSVESENFESIHNHSAYAMINRLER